MTTTRTDKLNKAVLTVRSLSHELSLNQWEIGDTLATLAAEDFEKGITRLVAAAKLPRNSLTIMRTTALAWPAKQRLAGVPYYLHQRYRYRVAELKKAFTTNKIQFTAENRLVIKGSRARTRTTTNLTSTIEQILDIADDRRVSDKTFRKEVIRRLARWVKSQAA